MKRPAHPILRLTLAVAVLTAQSGFAAEQPDQQAIDLRPRFMEGSRSQYTVWSRRQQRQSFKIGPRSHDVDTRFEIEAQVTWAVEKAQPDGSATCVMTLDWITSELTGPDGQVHRSDSRRSTGQPEALHQLLRAMAGVPVTINVKADGTVVGAKGFEGMKKRVPDQMHTPDERDFMESASDLALIAAAPSAVAVDGKWDAQFTWNHQMGQLHQSMSYKLSGVEEVEGIPLATVTGSARLRLEPDPKLLPNIQGVRTDTRLLDGHAETQIMFDLRRREAVGRNTTETRKIEIVMRGPKQSITRTINEQVHSQVLRVAEQ